MRDELFRSDNLCVRRRGGGAGGTVIVSFGSYTSDPSLDRAGFGEEFLVGAGIDAIHVVNRANHWYQHPERDDALAAIAAAVAGYDRAITYGSSMGGYAALRFARACGADTAVAISPQYSIDPRIVPWETRWQADVACIRFAEPPPDPAPCEYVIYDPRIAPDAAHAALFVAAGAVPVRIPYGGHPVGAMLVETGALQAGLRAIIAGHFRAEDMERRVRIERRRSQHRYFALAGRAAPRRPRAALAMIRRAAAIEPESHIVSLEAALLDRLGRGDEAAACHRAAITRTPTNALARLAFAAHLEHAGNVPGAAEQLRAALPGQSAAMRLRVRVAQLRLWLRRHRLRLLDAGVARVVAAIEASPHQAAILRAIGRRLR